MNRIILAGIVGWCLLISADKANGQDTTQAAIEQSSADARIEKLEEENRKLKDEILALHLKCAHLEEQLGDLYAARTGIGLDQLQTTEPTTKPAALGFRGCQWGMSVAEVKRIESSDPVPDQKDPDVLAYRGAVAGLHCFILYIFADDKLVRGKYVITEQHANDNDYIGDMGTLETILKSKYGVPDDDKPIVKGEVDRDRLGMGIATGKLVLQAHWNNVGGEYINLVTSGDNYQITMQLEYGSIELHSLDEKQQKLDKTKGL